MANWYKIRYRKIKSEKQGMKNVLLIGDGRMDKWTKCIPIGGKIE